MSEKDGSVGRRDFLRRTSAAGFSIGMAKSVLAAGGTKMVGDQNNSCQIVAVCDVYEKRKRENAAEFKCEGYLDYREVVGRADVDAVIVATPDHC